MQYLNVIKLYLIYAVCSVVMGLSISLTKAYLKNHGVCIKDRKPLLRALHDVWISFASNFAVDMSMDEHSDRNDSRLSPVRILLLSVFFTGNVIFMGYRASLTSNLSVRSLRLPFTDLHSLLDTDFR